MSHLHSQVSHAMKRTSVEQQHRAVYTFLFQWLNDLFVGFLSSNPSSLEKKGVT